MRLITPRPAAPERCAGPAIKALREAGSQGNFKPRDLRHHASPCLNGRSINKEILVRDRPSDFPPDPTRFPVMTLVLDSTCGLRPVTAVPTGPVVRPTSSNARTSSPRPSSRMDSRLMAT